MGDPRREDGQALTLKRCSKRGKHKPHSAFTHNQRRRDGLDPWCRACKQAYYLFRKLPGSQVRRPPAARNVLSPGMREKYCTGCGRLQPIDDFGRDHRMRDGHVKRCRPCLGIQRKERGFTRGSLEARLAWERKYYSERHDQILAYSKTYSDRLRQHVLAAYGHRCACCGETAAEFLAVDHVEGRGGEELKHLGVSGRGFYLWLKRRGFPRDRFRLLCHNCNSARGLYGYCPHERNVP
jgi:hypothetical protein